MGGGGTQTQFGHRLAQGVDVGFFLVLVFPNCETTYFDVLHSEVVN